MKDCMVIVKKKLATNYYLQGNGLSFCYQFVSEAYLSYGALKFVMFKDSPLLKKGPLKAGSNIHISFTIFDLLESTSENFAMMMSHVSEYHHSLLKEVPLGELSLDK